MPGIPTEIFGPMIREKRQALGWSQEQLAEQALGNGDRKGHISQIETGKLRHVSDEDAKKLLRALGIDLSEIVRLKALGDAVGAPSDASSQADLDRLVSENGSLREALDNLRHLTRDGLIALATRFGIADAHRLQESTLRAGLADKAEEYNRYRAQIEHIDERVAGLGNLKAAARDAAERLDFEEVETLLSRVDHAETEIAAQTKELRADNFLLQGRTKEAFDVLSAAADSFGGIDRLEPARRREDYGRKLYEHGVRYGGEGLHLSERMLKVALEMVAKTDDPHLWSSAQNNLGNALSAQGTRIAGEIGAALLSQAVDAHRAALTIRTQIEYPLQWATTQNNLGNAFNLQGSRTAGEAGVALLTQAAEAFRAALTVYTEVEHPLNWAILQDNLANFEIQRAQNDSCFDPAPHLATALEHVTAALTVYAPAKLLYYHDKATALRDNIIAELKALDG